PMVFVFRDVLNHIDGLFRTMNDASSEIAPRKAAQKRLARIYALPDLRKFKERISVSRESLAQAVDETLARVDRLRKNPPKTIQQVQRALKAEFPDWPERHLKRV